MKKVKYSIIFIILALIGFYIGSSSEIIGEGLRFAEVENRGPASPVTQLQEVFSSLHFEVGPESVFLTTAGGDNYCEFIEGLDEYTVHLIAEGVSSGDKEIKLSFSGSCSAQRKVVVFDKAVCDFNRSYSDFLNGFYGSDDSFVKGYDLDSNIPMRALEFYISLIEVAYNNDLINEEVMTPGDEVKSLFSCESFTN